MKRSALYGKLALSSNSAGHPKVENREPEAKFVKYAHNKAKETTGGAKVFESLAERLTHRILSKVVLRFSEDKDLGELCDCPETLLSIKEVEDAVDFQKNDARNYRI